jgi:hypothetical protein
MTLQETSSNQQRPAQPMSLKIQINTTMAALNGMKFNINIDLEFSKDRKNVQNSMHPLIKILLKKLVKHQKEHICLSKTANKLI